MSTGLIGQPGGASPPLVAQLRAATVRYGSTSAPTVALDAVDLAIQAASMTAVVGRSGSGKSTLLSLLALLRTPTAGQVLIEGVDLAALREGQRARLRATRIGVVFQAFHLEPSLSAAQNVMLPWFTGVVGGSHRSAQARAVELLEVLGIPELAGRLRDEMSGGQRQRVALARALFARPALLLADEPTGNLDEHTADQVTDTLAALPGQLGTALVVVTHDRAIAAKAQQRLELVAGRIAAVEVPAGADR